MLFHIQVWTEAEWHAIPVARKPQLTAHFPGLGWIAALPVLCLN
jgi:hypothetical protein